MNNNHPVSGQSHLPDANNYRRSVQTRIAVVCGIVLLLAVAVTGVVLTNQHTESITKATVTAVQVQARTAADMAARLIIGDEIPDGPLLTDICQSLIIDNPSVYWVGISDTTNTYIAHTDIRKVVTGTKISAFSPSQIQLGMRDLEGVYEFHSDTLAVMVPIVNRGFEVGALTLAASSDMITQARNASIRTIGMISLIIMLVAFLFGVLLTRRMLRPVRTITESIRTYAEKEGELQVPVTSRDEFGYLAASLMAMDAQVRGAQKTRLENERIAKELEFARDLQASILPEFWPNASNYAFAGWYRSAKQTGGDYYDFIQLDNHRLGFLIADVAGKSLPGMLVMLLTREAIRKAGRRLERPRDLLIHLNEELRGRIRSGTFVTMFYGILDSERATVTYSSAGHNALVRVKHGEGEAQILKTTGLPLGVFNPQMFEKQLQEASCTLEVGDFLVQYTDGVTEALNIDGEQFGVERFVRLLSRNKEESANGLIQKIVAEHSRFVGEAEQYDDITLLALKWGAAIQTVTEEPDEEVYAEIQKS